MSRLTPAQVTSLVYPFKTLKYAMVLSLENAGLGLGRGLSDQMTSIENGAAA